ncbi:unnamed protein product [Schistosoma curassoni]|uniref:Uncharacterized protein n=1 Tax=Schistosoma curassoni TaxID=6186 RepID=A0A183K228_9TREM|nr:unnamed protein product [Schistosoma curassoni]
MVASDQQLVHTLFVPTGYWSPCAPLVWNPVKAPNIRFSSSQFRKQQQSREKSGFNSRGIFMNENKNFKSLKNNLEQRIKRILRAKMAAGGSQQKTLDLGFVLLGTRQQGVL